VIVSSCAECVRGNSHADLSAAPSDVARPQTFRRALAPFRVQIGPAGIELLEIDGDMPAALTPAQRLRGAEQKTQFPVVIAVYNVPDPQAVILRLRLGKPDGIIGRMAVVGRSYLPRSVSAVQNVQLADEAHVSDEHTWNGKHPDLAKISAALGPRRSSISSAGQARWRRGVVHGKGSQWGSVNGSSLALVWPYT
jgi:hypothetical protein